MGSGQSSQETPVIIPYTTCPHPCPHLCPHTHLHTPLDTCLRTCLHTCLRTCLHTGLHMPAHMPASMSAPMFAPVSTPMSTHTATHMSASMFRRSRCFFPIVFFFPIAIIRSVVNQRCDQSCVTEVCLYSVCRGSTMCDRLSSVPIGMTAGVDFV